MKRCPQCEFIYEDDQICCDMDGIDLVFDQPTPAAVSSKPAGQKGSSSRRSILAICAVVFGVLAFAIGYASLERAFTASSEPAVVTNAPANQPAVQPKEEPAPQEEPAVTAVGEDPAVSAVSHTATTSRLAARNPALGDLESQPAGTEPLRGNSPGTRGVVVGSLPRQERVDPSQPQTEKVKGTPPAAPAKKDSKVVSIVKKTGRFLTKPFK